MRQKAIALLTGLLLLCCCLFQPWSIALADTAKTGTVAQVDPSLRVREGPGTSYKQIDSLLTGDVVTILDEQDGWYKIQKGLLIGWASADYITLNSTPVYTPDASFEELLNAFPEDYKEPLRRIHAEFPKWKFVPEPLSMTWATALSRESRVRVNTVLTSYDSWKSMELGAYDWATNTYVNVDSGYVTADPLLIAYYMDPRNFLDSTYIFQFEDLSFSDTQTEDGVRAILPDALDYIAADLLRASRETRVSAYFMATRITQEGSHKNGLGTGTVPGYEGYYNFFNYGAKPNADGTGAVTNGAIYAKNNGWNTPYKALYDSAASIGKGYINLGQDTLYYQKFNMTNTTSGLYTHQYMTNVQAPSSEGSIRRRSMTQEALDSELVFTIPVYKEMPQAVAPKPTTTGNNNNFLHTLSVEGQALTPSFDRYTAFYSLQVGSGISQVTIHAERSDGGATVNGGGTVNLAPGENNIPITVTATSGKTRTYTVSIFREIDPNNPYAPSIGGGGYTVTDKITGVKPETQVSDFLASLQVQNGTAALLGTDNQPKADGFVATGDILQLKVGNTVYKTYPVIITGDANGDGKITSQDLRRIQRHILGAAPISGHPLTAADANADGAVTSQDLRRIQRYILGLLNTL